MKTWVARSVACLLVGSYCAGCSTTSTIHRSSGLPVEADIEGGSADAILVNAHGHRDVIARSDITDIDYPGNVHAGVGGGLLGYGVLNVLVGMRTCEDRSECSSDGEQAGFCTGVFIPGAVGLGMLIWGLVVNGSEKSAVKDRSLSIE